MTAIKKIAGKGKSAVKAVAKARTNKAAAAKASPQHARPTVRVVRPMGMQARGR